MAERLETAFDDLPLEVRRRAAELVARMQRLLALSEFWNQHATSEREDRAALAEAARQIEEGAAATGDDEAQEILDMLKAREGDAQKTFDEDALAQSPLQDCLARLAEALQEADGFGAVVTGALARIPDELAELAELLGESRKTLEDPDGPLYLPEVPVRTQTDLATIGAGAAVMAFHDPESLQVAVWLMVYVESRGGLPGGAN